MLRQERVGLGVEHEVLRRSLNPKLRCLLVGNRIEGAVDLGNRKPGCVEAKPLLGGRGLRRIPPALDQRGLGPGRNADPNPPHQLGRCAAGASLTWLRRVRSPCGIASRTASRLSTTPRGLPGNASTSVRPMTPANDRESMAWGVFFNPAARIASAIPGTG